MPIAQQMMIILQEVEVEDMVGLVEIPTLQLHLLLLASTQGTLMMLRVTGTGQVVEEVLVGAFGQVLLLVDYSAICLVIEAVNRTMGTGDIMEGEDGGGVVVEAFPVVVEVAFLEVVPQAPEQPQALVEQAGDKYCPKSLCDIFFIFILGRCRRVYCLLELIRSRTYRITYPMTAGQF